jgi:hypothetical protein
MGKIPCIGCAFNEAEKDGYIICAYTTKYGGGINKCISEKSKIKMGKEYVPIKIWKDGGCCAAKE